MGESQSFRLVLASGSPARRDLLTRAGFHFEVIPSDVEEPVDAGPHPRTFVQHVAWLKAAAVAPLVDRGIVLAADTVGWLHGQPIGKPTGEADARRILRLLGGTQHELWTGVCLWKRPLDVQLAWQEMSRVAFKALTEEELSAYLATRLWQGCSGAYAIQEKDDPYVHLLAGSQTNVVGLPMETLGRALSWLAQMD